MGKGSARLSTPAEQDRQWYRKDIDLGVRQLTDPAARVRDLDKRGADAEVIYSTLWGVHLTHDVDLDVALCRAYNRWMGEVWAQGDNRLRWTAVFPLTSIEESIKQLHYAKEHGAVGVNMRGIEGDRSLAEPYFFPLYEEASRLDFPICIHIGAGSPAITSVFDVRVSHTLPHLRMLPLIAFRDLVANRIPEKFPGLRFGFVEAGAPPGCRTCCTNSGARPGGKAFPSAPSSSRSAACGSCARWTKTCPCCSTTSTRTTS